ncbi:MAG TPA: N-acetyltransferase [Bacteroidales bacterium]|nr:N-acetyltransferase [Bacteroidales bacterium]
MKIILLNKIQLQEFLNSEKFKTMPVIPISPHRGLSHIKNPRALEQDILLILAYDDRENMIGYLGLLPDDLFIETKKIHCAWMSCIWVSEQSRGKGIAQKLVSEAYNCWDGKILATEFTPQAMLLYKKINLFENFITKQGTRIYLRFVLTKVLIKKTNWLKIAYPLLFVIDLLANLFVDIWQKKQYRYIQADNLIFSETLFDGSVKYQNMSNGFFRGYTEINWMINCPWLSLKKHQKTDKKYHFSSWARQVKNIFVKNIRTNATLMLFVRDGHLKIPYVWGDWHYKELQQVFAFVVKKYKVAVVTVYHQELIKQIDTLPHIFQKNNIGTILLAKK